MTAKRSASRAASFDVGRSGLPLVGCFIGGAFLGVALLGCESTEPKTSDAGSALQEPEPEPFPAPADARAEPEPSGVDAGFDLLGVCGRRGEAIATSSRYSGFEEFYLLGDEGFGEEICIVRFDVERVGASPYDCAECEWAHRVEYRSPSVTLDEGGVCARSELGMDARRIQELTGSRAVYGFFPEYAGHNSVLVKYENEASMWQPFGNATWDPETREARFDRRDGFCRY